MIFVVEKFIEINKVTICTHSLSLWEKRDIENENKNKDDSRPKNYDYKFHVNRLVNTRNILKNHQNLKENF